MCRVLLGTARFNAAPFRFVNVEESYNATVAWLLARAPMWELLPDLQYRSFCGGCSAVSVLGVPFLRFGGDALWAWKAAPLLWGVAAMLAGFFALGRIAGRAAAWAWVALWCLPPVGALDLSLMLWGNHQESGLFVLLAAWAFAARRGVLLGLTLGLGFWFARTSAYAMVVLAPAALLSLHGQRGRFLLAMALGAAPVLVDAGGGDAGWYRFGDALAVDVAGVPKRAMTLLSPSALGARLWLPARDAAPLGALWLVAGLGGAALAAMGRIRLVLALQVAWVAAYCGTTFPIFLVSARVPVNNIRYHAPWALLLTLGVAVGFGTAWQRGWRRSAALGLALLLAGNGLVLARLPWRSDPRAWSAPVVDLAGFVQTVAPRVPSDALGRSDDPRADALLRRLRGLRLGREYALSGALERAGDDPIVRSGVGEALVEPCAELARVAAVVEQVPEPARLDVGRGMALTLGLCEERRTATLETLGPLMALGGGALAAVAGPALVARCAAAPQSEVAVVGACLARHLALLPPGQARRAAFGCGRAWAPSLHDPADITRMATSVATFEHDVRAGAEDIAAGTRVPPFARERALPGLGAPP
ncbi:MAG: hypothetical protein EXR71_05070 [Myxococcales bacterium]|nr:hypothetical protein [Myxococcales bacterium]